MKVTEGRVFEKWIDKETRVISLWNYKKWWSKNGTGRQFSIFNNGAKKGRIADSCYSLTIQIGYLSFNYTNFAFNRKLRGV